MASSLEETSKAKRDSLVTHLNQMEKEVEGLKKAKVDYVDHLLNSEEGRQESNNRLSIAEGEKAKAEQDLAETKK